MNFEFDSLAKKIERLAELADALRTENAELRRNAGIITAQNVELQQHMDEAYSRVSALIQLLPVENLVAEEIV